MEIIAKRLLLREFAETDLPELEAYQTDPRYVEFWPDAVPANHTRELLTLFRRWAVDHPRRNYQLAVAPRHSPHELIGCCGLRCQGMAADCAEFGIEVAPQSRGRGHATEAARAILSFGFRELGLQEVRGISVTENTRVTSMASRLGFTSVGSPTAPACMAARGWSQTEWQLTRPQWEATGRLPTACS